MHAKTQPLTKVLLNVSGSKHCWSLLLPGVVLIFLLVTCVSRVACKLSEKESEWSCQLMVCTCFKAYGKERTKVKYWMVPQHQNCGRFKFRIAFLMQFLLIFVEFLTNVDFVWSWMYCICQVLCSLLCSFFFII